MFIGRREDGSIYGAWACRQFEGQEELPEDHAEVVAFPIRRLTRAGCSIRRSAYRRSSTPA